jgi:hypothetical protein
MKTLANLRTDLRNELFTDPNGKIWKDALLNDYINQAYLRVESDGQFLWDENEHATVSAFTVSGTAEYDLPTNLVRTQCVKFNGIELEQVTKSELFKRYPSETYGTPYCYYIRANKIGFYPTPNLVGTYELLFLSKADVLDEDTDEIIYPDDFARAIVKYASYLAWSSPRGNRQTAEEKLVDYTRIIQMLISSYQTKEQFDYRVRRNYRNSFNPKGINL